MPVVNTSQVCFDTSLYRGFQTLDECESRCERHRECSFFSFISDRGWCKLTDRCTIPRDESPGTVKIFSCQPMPHQPPISPSTAPSSKLPPSRSALPATPVPLPLMPPLPPPPPPLPPTLPLLAGEVQLASADELRSLLATAKSDLHIFVPPGVLLRTKGREIVCARPMRVLLRSSGAGATIDGESRSRLFKLTNGCDLSLQTIHLTNGFAEGLTQSGGAIFSSGKTGAVRLADASITNCSAGKNGGAVAFWDTLGVWLTRSHISNCKAMRGGAVAGERGGQLHLYRSLLTHCRAEGQVVDGQAVGGIGGAVHLVTLSSTASSASSGVDLVESTVADCSATNNGGGIALFDSAGGIALRDSRVERCQAGTFGGGISSQENRGVVEILRSQLINNTAPGVSALVMRHNTKEVSPTSLAWRHTATFVTAPLPPTTCRSAA